MDAQHKALSFINRLNLSISDLLHRQVARILVLRTYLLMVATPLLNGEGKYRKYRQSLENLWVLLTRKGQQV